MIDHKKYTIDFIASIFNCSKYLVKKACKWKQHSVGIEFPTKNKIKRNKLDIQKCEHFLDYLFTSGLTQDVAYSITKLEFDSGGTKTIPHAVLTANIVKLLLHIFRDAIRTNSKPCLKEQCLDYCSTWNHPSCIVLLA